MSEESMLGSNHEEICEDDDDDDDSFDPEEWIEWFDYFKDERGDWITDDSTLKAMSVQFLKKQTECESEENEEEKEVETKEGEEEIEGEGSDSSDEPTIQKLFRRKLSDFAEFTKHYLLSKRSTLVDCNRPYRASNPKFWFYKEFREYLESHGFIETMIDLLVKMFNMHPELPDKPLKFIRDNYGISQKEEDRLITEWTAVTEEMVKLQDEGKALEKRIKWRLKQPREKDSTTSEEKLKPQIDDLSESKQDQLQEEKDREDSSKESSPFHWECSDPSSIPSSPSSVRPVGSEITLLPSEEEEQPERSVTPQYEYDDFDRTEGSSSSLDVGSI